MNVKEEYDRLMRLADFAQPVPVSEQEEAEIQDLLQKGEMIPPDVYLKDDVHVRNQIIDISPEELQSLCALKTYLATNTIKKCAIFFTVILALSLIMSFISVIALFA